ncbi:MULTISPECIES: hypothetical protein [unclassified Agarivorans]|uniref:hypothetical protein n=1 Tax=unclassified Agarivorans TaxID=2636026 RepID=UPI0026E43FF7|nr:MULTISPECIES: hypothetical protein [unclassified Agarivorans]MDO6687481.1 hypothetical protein [Agarivorans sp. 3_MG-2023]MDO6715247.1 hypothetical protein [Agarivorans sp. 2_MG-2023]MDO6763456.1 hypothetical protein [Agarivorans sp. 1_MG-2023]
MKLQSLPSYVDDAYVNDVVSECISFMKGTAPWWVKQSCLECRESKRLLHIFLIAFSSWRKRQAQPSHKRGAGPNNRFDLGPLIYDLSYTINQLVNQDISLLNDQLKTSLTAINQDSQQFLKDWHNLDVEQFTETPLSNVS